MEMIGSICIGITETELDRECKIKGMLTHTVEPVYIEHSQEMKKCSMYAGVQCIHVLSNWRSGEIETKKGN